jgi:nitroimidazol reductase NimA-like FMN-containing flavoprotein (pyridoxamine 5'-phosphate oxidase superfamily)
MFRDIRRKEKELTIEECNEILLKAEYGTLATIGTDGYPYAVPVNYIFQNGCIYFHCATVGHKLDNIENYPNVSFNVVTDVRVIPLISEGNINNNDLSFSGFDTNFNSVIVFGKAREVIEQEKIDGLSGLLKRFLNDADYFKYKDAGIEYIKNSLKRTKLIGIDIEHVTGKRGIRENKQISGKQH